MPPAGFEPTIPAKEQPQNPGLRPRGRWERLTLYYRTTHGGAVVEALRYKPEGRGIDSRWCHWKFLLT
jgi:hypothetical protein